METLRAAIERLERAGYADALRARADGFLDLATGRIHPPEAWIVDEIVRFEGESDPDDEAVLFALRSRDESVRATFVATYGPSADAESGMLVKRLNAAARGPLSRASTPTTRSG